MRASGFFLPLGVLLLLVSPAAADLSDGLILYYNFDVDEGGAVTDQSGNGHLGTVYGATHCADGIVGGSYDFDGVDDRIMIGNLGTIPAGTISYWMCADAVENWRNAFAAHYNGYDGRIRFEETDGGWFYCGIYNIFTTSLQPATWYHVVLCWNDTVYRGYLNGEPAFSNLLADIPAGEHYNVEFPNAVIGSGYSTAAARQWKGLIDEFRIYDRCIEDVEVQQLYDQRPQQHGFITLIGFSNDPEGDQDVTEFLSDETLHIRVRDVDLDAADPNCSVGATLFQKKKWGRAGRSRKVRVDLVPQEDGSFRAAVPLDLFSVGMLEVQIKGTSHGAKDKLERKGYIFIHPVRDGG